MSVAVYANGSEVACKAGAGKVIAEFPDVCLSPPPPPAGPVPIPYAATSFSKDMQSGSKSVQIGGKEIMLKDKSFYKTSPLGNEAATRNFGANVITHVITGKTYFTSWSMDVKVESENVDRHMDLATSNHGSQGPGTPPSSINTASVSPPRKYPEQTCDDSRREEIKRDKDAVCNTIPGGSLSPKKVSPKKLAKIPCSTIQSRLTAQRECLRQRQLMKGECFNKGPDPSDSAQVERHEKHEQAISDVQNGIVRSQELAAINCAPGHPMAGL